MSDVDSSRARSATAVTFAAHGLLFASWTAHIPHVQQRLGASHGELGLALAGAPVGAVLAMILAGKLLARRESAYLVRIACVGYCLVGCFVALSDDVWTLGAALAVWGALQGSLDVFMNTQATIVEEAYQRPIMSTFHGCWSIGAFLGAVTGAGAVGLGVGLGPQLLVIGGVLAVVTGRLNRSLLAARPPCNDRHAHSAPLSEEGSNGYQRQVILLGVIAFACMLCEGAVADWSAIHLREDLSSPSFVAGLGYATFAVTMVTTRLSSTRLFARIPPVHFITAAALFATCGMAVGILVESIATFLIGLAVLGLGLATVVPTTFTAAGRLSGPRGPGAGIAAVSALGWAGFLCGPPLIGLLSQFTSLPAALLLIPLLTAIITALARFTPALRSTTVG